MCEVVVLLSWLVVIMLVRIGRGVGVVDVWFLMFCM